MKSKSELRPGQQFSNMIEVFRTNVSEKEHADKILYEIHTRNQDYVANFDLDDCDRILRIRALTGNVKSDPIIQLMQELGYEAVALE